MPGVHEVVIADGFAGVVADTRRQAQAAAAELETDLGAGLSLAAGRAGSTGNRR